ncbi:MAG: aminotransferase class I/II-fold pyridoxal phosphate-dependent enzyme [Anaerofustis stercorihominis]|nr:aminotransferase class I/II-fold pyridoxal phosphate-dependent enzyme [Anaerofustis stercorihominis]
MNTPIYDFINSYTNSDYVRFHMPGHKGKKFLGFENMDITEFKGADSLYEADGIIRESENNASLLFGTQLTSFSTEGSSQCIKAMMYLAMINKKTQTRPVVVAARNVHKSFIHAATLLDFDIVWLWPEGDLRSLCSCEITADALDKTLSELDSAPMAVFITSPDYLGGTANIKALSEICHKYGSMLIVDNAHGAYLKFLEPSQHPIDLGADICCDSAHKTLPVLTGGAYLHISKNAPCGLREYAKYALGLFGSTSPSYLILASLDICNKYLADRYRDKLKNTTATIEQCRVKLRQNGWKVEETDPLRITVCVPDGMSGNDIADLLRKKHIECEYSDPEFVVLMATPENEAEDFDKLITAFGKNTKMYSNKKSIPAAKAEQKMSIRQAIFSSHEFIPASESEGRICRELTVACPPAIPIAVPGELIGRNAVDLFDYYGIERVDVVK